MNPPPSPRHSDPQLLSGALLVAASALFFSTKAVVVKCAYPYGVDALTLLTLRMGLSLPVFLAIVWHEERRAVERLAPHAWLACLGLGVLGYYVSSYLDFVGLRFIGVGLERMVLYLYPSLVLLITACWLRQPLTRTALVALAATYLGIVLTYAGQSEHGEQVLRGTLLVAGCAVSYALFIVAGNSWIKRVGGTRFVAIAMSGAGIAMLLHFALTHELRALAQPAPVIAYGVILAVVGTILPTLLMGVGMKRVGAQRFAVISTIGPVGTVLLGWLVLGERPSALNLLGMMLTIAGGVVMGLAKATPSERAPGANQVSARRVS